MSAGQPASRAAAVGRELTVAEAILRRRSVRRFSPEPVPEPLLQRLLELAVAAPSSWNLQPWRIVVVRDEVRRGALRRACYNQQQVGEAPLTLVFAVSTSAWRDDLGPMVDQAERLGAWPPEYCAGVRARAPEQQERLRARRLLREFHIRDAMVAATQTALAAESLGLASCMMSGWQEEPIKEAIGADGAADLGIAVLLELGYAAERPRDPGRFPLRHNVFRERLGDPFPEPASGDGSALPSAPAPTRP